MTPIKAAAIALLAALAWGTGNVAQKTILQHLDGWSATAVTSFVGVLVLLPFALRERRQAQPSAKGSWPLILTVSLLFTFGTTVMQFGYGLTTVTNAGFLVNTAAVMTPVLTWLFLSQPPPLAIWPASLATLVGVFLMTGASWAGFSPGDLLSLLAALGFAIWTLAVGHYVTRYRRPILLTTVQLAICGLLCLFAGGAIQGFPTLGALTAALPEILFLGLVSKGLAYVLMAIAQQHISATSVAVLVSAEAVFGAAIAAAVLNEDLDPIRGIGGLCIIVGVVIAARLAVTQTEGNATVPVKQIL